MKKTFDRSHAALLAGAVGLMLLAATGSAEPALPMDPKGQIILSWDKFNEMWETFVSLKEKVKTLEAPGLPPPVPYALSGAAYRGAVKAGAVEMEALFSLEVFEPKGWVKVPFLPASVAVTGAALDGKPVGLIQENGMHTALVKGAGRHALRVNLSLRSPKEEEAPALSLPVPATPMTALSLFFPRPGLEITVEGAQGQETRPEAGGTRVTAALSPTTALSLRWHRALPADKVLPRKVYVDGEAIFTVSEGALRGRWTLRYTVLHQGVRELPLRLPEGWNVLGVSAEGLEEWKIDDEGTLVARFTHPRKGAVELVVEAERGLADKEDLIPLPRLAPLGVERETGVIAIQAKGAVEVEVPEASGVRGLDPQELPPSVWGQAQHPILHAFRHTGKPSLALAVTRHPDVAVLTTTIDLANALTVMTRRGETVTRLQYHVRNRVKQHLTVKLPAGAELWSAFVGGEPVKPARLPDGGYRLPLRRSGDGGADEVLVEVVTFARRGAFDAFGKRAMDLPLPDAPVSRALWSLYLPPNAKPLAFGGDMDRTPNAYGEPFREPVFDRVTRVLGRAMRKESRERRNGALAAAAPAAQLQGRLLEDSFRQDHDGMRAGVFPVSFRIPEEGTLYHFGRVMIVGESPRVTFTYAGGGMLGGFWMLLLGGAAGALWRGRRRLASLRTLLKRSLSGEDAPA